MPTNPSSQLVRPASAEEKAASQFNMRRAKTQKEKSFTSRRYKDYDDDNSQEADSDDSEDMERLGTFG